MNREDYIDLFLNANPLDIDDFYLYMKNMMPSYKNNMPRSYNCVVSGIKKYRTFKFSKRSNTIEYSEIINRKYYSHRKDELLVRFNQITSSKSILTLFLYDGDILVEQNVPGDRLKYTLDYNVVLSFFRKKKIEKIIESINEDEDL